jgi:hypothetical protein
MTLGTIAQLKVLQRAFQFQQYADVYDYLSITGGQAPFSFTIVAGSLPPGVILSPSDNRLGGNAISQGAYQFSVRVRDSFSPPEEVVQQFTAVVGPPVLSIQNSIPGTVPLGVPFSGAIVARGGTPPYTYARTYGSLPPGIGEIDSTGHFGGTPTFPGSYTLGLKVLDSSTPARSAFTLVYFAVEATRGRNDTIASATPEGNGTTQASISPYVDPPNGPPFPGDVDYYRLRAAGGSIVHIETRAKRLNMQNPLDTVLEIVDANNHRLNFCQLPGDTSAAYSSPCVNDDLSSSPHVQDSALDFRAPGAPDADTTFYARVFDWRGDARPDMTYQLEVQGTVPPLLTASSLIWAAIKGHFFSKALPATGGVLPVNCCSLASGPLPAGLMLSGAQVVGTPTTLGEYTFTVQASDAGNPPEVAVVPVTIDVVEPLAITTSATLPDACLNQPYSFTPQVAGGLPGYGWTYVSITPWSLQFSATNGAITGIPLSTGTYRGQLGVFDATGQTNGQTISIVVKQCS